MGIPPKEKEILESMPTWLRLPVPPNAIRDEKIVAEALALVHRPEELHSFLSSISSSHLYPYVINLINAEIWKQLPIWVGDHAKHLVIHAGDHFTRKAEITTLRRVAKHPEMAIRGRVQRRLKYLQAEEVALPRDKNSEWSSTSGWFAGIKKQGDTFKIRQSEKLDEFLPKITTVFQLRELLKIKSSNQLGWLLLATAGDNMPYHQFEISKRNGQPRQICAPNWQLREVQRRILQLILEQIPVHDCAHGFVSERSIYTNAAAHVGNELLLKFDLQDFFPHNHLRSRDRFVLKFGVSLSQGEVYKR